MELIPIDCKVSVEIVATLELAGLYADAGMCGKSNSLYQDAVLDLCKDNDIPIIKSYDSNILADFEGKRWAIEALGVAVSDVPPTILKRMAKIKEKGRLSIAYPNDGDPLLLYRLPYNRYKYIILARWE